LEQEEEKKSEQNTADSTEAVKTPIEASEVTPDNSGIFRGIITRVTFRAEDTGFAVIKAEAESGMQDPEGAPGGLSTVIGILPEGVGTGSNVIAQGNWSSHPKFGRQFRARSIHETTPTGTDAISKYLSSGAVKGFGPVLAQRVIERFGEQSLEVIEETPQKLLEVQGIGQRKLDEILESWEEKRAIREILIFFQSHNIPLGLAQRIYRAYGSRAVEVVKSNPYVLCRDVWGIGFQTADRVAQAFGVALDSSERCGAGLGYALQQASDDGHCFLPREELQAKTQKLLSLDSGEIIDASLKHNILAAELIEEPDVGVYLPSLYSNEQILARCIASRINDCTPSPEIPTSILDSILEKPQLAHSGNPPQVIHLSEQQQEAVRMSSRSTLAVITGGPGCGKTTVLRTVASLYRKAGLRIALAAPTGRAAQRLSEVCGMPASTIHRLLRFDPMRKAFVHDHLEQLELDVLIVDESSMIDLPLAASLLRAIPHQARLLIVGDSDQLPSVGPGLFLSDLLKTEEVPRVRLTNLFRRADESAITHIAHQINSGSIPHIPQPDGTTKTDAYFLRADTTADAAKLIERLVVEQIPKKFNLSNEQITVLTPMNQGELGVIQLNHRLQQRLVPKVSGLPWVKVKNMEFRHGDRVCQRVNNYNLHANGVFNGDQGVITGIDSEQKSIYVTLWDGREILYPSDALYQLDLAYALTIHRSQGSEVPAVVLALHDSHHIMLERQLIYTGITRAKQLLIVVGTKRALATASKRSRSRQRYSNLSERIQDILSA
jgi:exodeoxyribonuclease V alpha subunit